MSCMSENPFLTPSELPYQLPPFDRIATSDYLPAFEAGIAEQLAEVEAIATDTAAPTFENTLVALERSGQTLQRVSSVLFNLVSSHGTDEIHAIETEVAPKLATHHDAIYLDRRLFDRMVAVDDADLDDEQARLLQRYRTDFTRAGAELGAREQARLRELNAELSELASRFGQNLLAEANAAAVVVADATELAGAPDDVVEAASDAARARGLDGRYLLNLRLPTQQPLLATLGDPLLRRRLFEASVNRGCCGGDHDNSELAARMAALRAERAELLGYPTHADYVIADQTAGSAKAARTLLESLVPAAVSNARSEAERLRSTASGELRPWDRAYYAERVRKQLFDIDSADLRPYFELERVLADGVFFAANRLYGIEFRERHDLPTYHPGVRVFEVTEADGSPLGLFLADYYTRPEKSGGAWMNELVEQSELLDRKTVVVNNLNIVAPPEGQPTLLSFDEVTTMFHEFGHALHGLFSLVRYPLFSGTNVARDFVEYPSQVNEMWALWPEVLANYAQHYRTGEAMSSALAEKLVAAESFNQGFATTEYLAAALLDLSWHELGAADPLVTDVLGYEARALASAGLALPDVPPRYRTTNFKHIFAGGYSAGYYSYIFSEVLDADTVEWFRERGGLRRENGERFRKELLSKGFSVDPRAAYRTFRGRDPEIAPLLVRRHLTQAG